MYPRDDVLCVQMGLDMWRMGGRSLTMTWTKRLLLRVKVSDFFCIIFFSVFCLVARQTALIVDAI